MRFSQHAGPAEQLAAIVLTHREKIVRLWTKRLRVELHEVDLPGREVRRPLEPIEVEMATFIANLIGEVERALRGAAPARVPSLERRRKARRVLVVAPYPDPHQRLARVADGVLDPAPGARRPRVEACGSSLPRGIPANLGRPLNSLKSWADFAATELQVIGPCR